MEPSSDTSAKSLAITLVVDNVDKSIGDCYSLITKAMGELKKRLRNMGFSRRRSPNGLIYLTPVEIDNEKLPKGKIRILCCDAKGNIRSTIIGNSVYKLVKSYAEELERSRKNYAILSMEIAPDEAVPCAVVISSEHVWALQHILDHAIKRRKTPDILKKYLNEIVQIGELKREELKSQHEQAKDHVFSGKTPEVLHRLAYYTGECIEAAS